MTRPRSHLPPRIAPLLPPVACAAGGASDRRADEPAVEAQDPSRVA